MKLFVLLSLLSCALASIIGNHGEILIKGLDPANPHEHKYVNIDLKEGYAKFADFLLPTGQPNIWESECVDCGKSAWTKSMIDPSSFGFSETTIFRKIVTSVVFHKQKPSEVFSNHIRSMGSLSRLHFAEYILIGEADEVSADLILEVFFYDLDVALFELLIASKEKGS